MWFRTKANKKKKIAATHARSNASVLSVRQVPNEADKWLQRKEHFPLAAYLLNSKVTMLELRFNETVELIPAVRRWLFACSIAGPCLTPRWAISGHWSSRKVFTFLGERNWKAAVWCNESWVQFRLMPMLVLQLAPTGKSSPTSPPFQVCLPVSFFVQHSCFWSVNFLQVSFLNWVTAGPGRSQCWHQESGRNSQPGRRRRTRSGWLPFCPDCH